MCYLVGPACTVKIHTALEKLHKTEKRGRERTGKPKKEEERNPKKRKDNQFFAALLFEFWPAPVYYLNSVCVLQVATMAPSFAPSSSTYEYEVFVSFRGADNRTGFTSHLFAALDRKTIHAYKDDIKLPRGEKIGPELLKAIETSKIAVVVFSKKYVTSDWCLDELVKVIECKRVFNQRVLPIFYHVSQPEVLEQKGNFAELPNGPEDKMNSWRAALTEAANLEGLHLEPNR